ncbi:MAG TPA: polymer-forming cytoskeletal protein [Bryobacteraceae bacterium]|nr:polymer-forming cytoskeletal protein [Bryobacteraceae bacterium]
MWNKRPDEELPKPLTPAAVGAPARVAPNSMEVKKETPMFTTPTGKTEGNGGAVIGKAVKIVGEIYSNEDLLIEGFVQGTVEALHQKLTVGHNGTLQAKVQVRELDVQGNVQGDVVASERVEIRKDAKLVGNITAARIAIEDGAYFKGSIDIVKPEAAMKSEPSRPAVTLTTATPVTEAAFDMLVSGTR